MPVLCDRGAGMSRNLEALQLWRRALVSSVRKDGPDLSARQLALLLTVFLTPPPHTVRGLAAVLNVSNPAITRALDRLGRLGYIKRKRDQEDRRNVLVQRTVKGSVFLTEFGQMVIDAEKAPLAGEDGGIVADPVLDASGGVPPPVVDGARTEALATTA
jgi:DNA-binding MarR family transcriptional regulator